MKIECTSDQNGRLDFKVICPFSKGLLYENSINFNNCCRHYVDDLYNNMKPIDNTKPFNCKFNNSSNICKNPNIIKEELNKFIYDVRNLYSKLSIQCTLSGATE